MKIITVKNYEELSAMTSSIIASQINKKNDSVLGLATGSTPVGTYRNLVEQYRNGQIDFSHITTVNLDEYCGLEPKHPQSYRFFMDENLLKHVNINAEKIHFPTKNENFDTKIQKIGGIDLQLLGIGHNGHIGFNEPDTVFYNNTRVVKLAPSTINANSRFFDDVANVPKTAITMGMSTIMAARKIVLIAGADKTEIINKLSEDIVSPQFPASILHYHPDCTVILSLE